MILCKKLELWSNDIERGFPTPIGCYHSASGTSREVFILFSEKNGLAPDKKYQIVMNAQVKVENPDSPHLQLFTMQDVLNKPYSAIELGESIFNKERPVQTGAGRKQWATAPEFRTFGTSFSCTLERRILCRTTYPCEFPDLGV